MAYVAESRALLFIQHQASTITRTAPPLFSSNPAPVSGGLGWRIQLTPVLPDGIQERSQCAALFDRYGQLFFPPCGQQ